jgi:hypothetical protein
MENTEIIIIIILGALPLILQERHKYFFLILKCQ